MTSKNAIKLIQEIEEDGRNVTSDHVKALDFAIKALMAYEMPKGDLISREALKKSFEDTVCIEPMSYAFVKQIIDNVPTVDFVVNMKDLTAEEKQHFFYVWRNSSFKIINDRPQGEWIPNYTSQFMNPGKQCSLCGKIVEFSENYCPKCGAKMRCKNENMQ